MSVAVLLDNFVAETMRQKDEDNNRKLAEFRMKDSMGNSLDPLLKVSYKSIYR